MNLVAMSREEEDLLGQSTKKIKATIVSLTDGKDEVMDEIPHSRPSFKDMVMGTQGVRGFHEQDDLSPLDVNDGLISALDEEIRKLWNPKSDYELIDLGEGFFLVKFSSFSDLQLAVEEDPWITFGHYLTVRRWQPKFRQSFASTDSTRVSGKFSKVSVELDLNKELVRTENREPKVGHTKPRLRSPFTIHLTSYLSLANPKP
ncbi:hypothetical protein CRYUN_Cryun14cG0066200 [Craigia yunnanensis]